jgi:hypothetical protein
MNELGIADAMRPKIKLFPDGTKALEAIARERSPHYRADHLDPRCWRREPGRSSAGRAQLKTVYAAALAAKSAGSAAATAS